jgi:plasmid stability protein
MPGLWRRGSGSREVINEQRRADQQRLAERKVELLRHLEAARHARSVEARQREVIHARRCAEQQKQAEEVRKQAAAAAAAWPRVILIGTFDATAATRAIVAGAYSSLYATLHTIFMLALLASTVVVQVIQLIVQLAALVSPPLVALLDGAFGLAQCAIVSAVKLAAFLVMLLLFGRQRRQPAPDAGLVAKAPTRNDQVRRRDHGHLITP